MPDVTLERAKRWKDTGLWWLWLSAFSLLLDQVSKWLAEHFLADGSIPVMAGFQLSLAYNRGAAFSFLSNEDGWQVWFFSGLAMAVSALLVFWMWQSRRDETMQGLGLALILGGALGNLTDRLLAGQVVDFLDVYYGSLHWPTFNIADSSIFLGAVLFLLAGWRKGD